MGAILPLTAAEIKQKERLRKVMKKQFVSMLLTAAMVASLTACAGSAGSAKSSTKTPDPGSTQAPETKHAEENTKAANTDKADLVLKNGLIQTMTDEKSIAQAIAIRGNEIVYVGDDKGIEKYVSGETKVIDLKGQMVTPGFMDGHVHAPGFWIDKLYNIDLSQCKNNDEYLKVIKEFVSAHPEMEYYEGSPFMLNPYQQADGSNPGPQKEDLDAISPDKPIVITDSSHHAVWVNSAALKLAGITKDTPDPQGGLIKRHENGDPTGMLNDSAADLVLSKLPEKEITDDMITTAFEKFQEECNSYGITGITGITGIGTIAKPEQIRSIDKAGKLTLRIRLVPFVGISSTPEEAVSEAKSIKANDTPMVKGGTVKLFYDGVTEGATAVMLKPYTEAAGKGKDWYGEPVWNPDKFNEMVKALDQAGIQIHVHAIGDGAVKGTLDAFEAAQKANGVHDSRFTMTHVCAIQDSDIKRMADLKVVAALQFLWMYNDPFCQLEAAYVGEDRAFAFYPTKNMKNAGCIISGASDGPVSPFNVLDEIETGVTRNSPYAGEDNTDMHRWPEQALTPYEMLEAYTKNVAYENFEEKEIGTIETGKKADLVVLSQNIITCDPAAISDTKILYTISDGRIVYSGQVVK